jgi:hypothetical protein
MTRRQRTFLARASFVAILLVVVALTIHPGNNRALMGARESGAIREIFLIHRTQAQYHSQFGRYARSLAELGPDAAALLPSKLASGKKGGYFYVLETTTSGYALHVSPERYNVDGRRDYYSDETGVIRERWSAEPATALDRPIGTTGPAN